MVAIKILDFTTVNVPGHEKQSGQSLNRPSVQTDSTVLPVTKPLNLIDIFVCQIDATCIANLPINDQNLAVVSVVISYRQTGNHLIKFMGINPHLSQPFGIVSCQGRHTTNIIIKEFDLNSFFHFLL